MDKLQCWIFQRKTKVVAIVCVFILSFAFVKNLPSNLEIDFIDQTTPNMIQGLKCIFAKKPLILEGFSLF